MIKNITNLGDAAVYCDFGDQIDQEINLNVIKYFKNLRELKIEGIINITPSYNKLIVSFDPSVTSYENIKNKILNLKSKKNQNQNNKSIKIPICIDEEYSLDIKRLSKNLKIENEQIYNSFLDKEYYCYMTGFIAGMPFLGDTNEDIRLDRLETPRVKVPMGSIGITEQFCNIYTYESPGGWNIIGNTPIKVFNKFNQENPTLINPGDRVKFYKINKKEYQNYNE
jgi:KipI family sensor histidine kinase inhibitor